MTLDRSGLVTYTTYVMNATNTNTKGKTMTTQTTCYHTDSHGGTVDFKANTYTYGHQTWDVEDLRDAFTSIQDQQDWRGPITRLVPAYMADICAAAVAFMTATVATVTPIVTALDHGPVIAGQPVKDWALIEAEGYRMGPAGDH